MAGGSGRGIKMTKITIETETIETDLSPVEAAAKVREALGVREFPQMNDKYWFVNSLGDDEQDIWSDSPADHYRLAHGNCSPTQEGLAQHKANMAKLAAIVAIRKHRDKTFGVFEQNWADRKQMKRSGYSGFNCSITVYFAKEADIQRSFVECAEHWEVLK